MRDSGAICDDWICPYVPCKKFPKCEHIDEEIRRQRDQKVVIVDGEGKGMSAITESIVKRLSR